MILVAVQPHPAPSAVKLVFAVVYIGGWLLAVRSLTKHSETDFRTVGASKTKWLAALLVFGGLAAIPYWFGPRKRLYKLGDEGKPGAL